MKLQKILCALLLVSSFQGNVEALNFKNPFNRRKTQNAPAGAPAKQVPVHQASVQPVSPNEILKVSRPKDAPTRTGFAPVAAQPGMGRTSRAAAANALARSSAMAQRRSQPVPPSPYAIKPAELERSAADRARFLQRAGAQRNLDVSGQQHAPASEPVAL